MLPGDRFSFSAGGCEWPVNTFREFSSNDDQDPKPRCGQWIASTKSKESPREFDFASMLFGLSIVTKF